MDRRIPVAVPNFIGNEKKYVDECMDTVWISSVGKYISAFESKYADYFDVRHALSCCNGTVALHLPLLAMGIGPGDEVIVPTFTYIATANAVAYCGATPVFCDCDPQTWNLDVEDAKRRITKKTKAIIPVHMYGNPCDMDGVMALARENGLYVIEDAAECHGAAYRGRKAGTIGDVGTFSFFGNKIITTGEGGMIVTNHDEMQEKMRMLKGQGQDPSRRYWFTDVGYNYRMTNIEAAIGLAQLEKIHEHLAARKRVAEKYDAYFKGCEEYITLQKTTEHATHVYWMYSICLTKKARVSRDELMKLLDDDGIETRPLFYPMHVMPPYYDPQADCPVAEDVSARGLNIPTHALLSDEDIDYVAKKILKYVCG